MRISDWSSDVCSSDLGLAPVAPRRDVILAPQTRLSDEPSSHRIRQQHHDRRKCHEQRKAENVHPAPPPYTRRGGSDPTQPFVFLRPATVLQFEIAHPQPITAPERLAVHAKIRAADTAPRKHLHEKGRATDRD